MSTFDENREAGKSIAMLGGPDAVGMVMGLMAHNAEQLDNLEADLLQGMERDRDYWKDRAARAEAEIDLIHERFSSLLYVSAEAIEMRLEESW